MTSRKNTVRAFAGEYFVALLALGIGVNVVRAETGSALTEAEKQKALKMHNDARAAVGVAKLAWSNKLAKYAQAWADELARKNAFQHRPRNGKWAQKYGENIAGGFGENHVAIGVQRWLKEKDLYKGEAINRKNYLKFGHYTQMVWGKTTQIGVGKAKDSRGKWIIVANYNPPGNVPGQKPYTGKRPRKQPPVENCARKTPRGSLEENKVSRLCPVRKTTLPKFGPAQPKTKP